MQCREVLNLNGLCDMGRKRPKFTWSNCHGDESFTKEHLDRIVANKQWVDPMECVTVEVLTAVRSDHQPIFFHTQNINHSQKGPMKMFQFEAMWLKEAEIFRIIQQVLAYQGINQNKWSSYREKLNQCRAKLNYWHARHMENLTKEINSRMEPLKCLHSQEWAQP